MAARPSLARAALASLALAAVLVPAAAGANRRAADTPALSVVQRIAGIDQNAAGGYAPPDVQVAAGPGYVVEMVNLEVWIWRASATSAATLVSQSTLGDFFRVGLEDLTDPRVLYDARSGRWFASISTIDGDSVLLAVSATSDPTGAWTVSTFAAAGCADQPRVGTSDGLVVLAANIYSSCNGERFARLLGSQLWVADKAELLAGSTAPASQTFQPELDYSSLTPVDSLSATATEYVVAVDSGVSDVAHLLTVTGSPPDAVLTEVATPAIDHLSPPPAAAEPAAHGGSATDIETNDDRVLDAVWEQGKLWFTADTGCPLPTAPIQRACGFVAELATATGTVDWQQVLGDQTDEDVYFPSVRPDAAGDAIVVYGRSTATLTPVVESVARTPDGTWTAPARIASSAAPAGPTNDRRWGDYFGSARDPLDPSVVWIAGETGPAAAGSTFWTTTVAAVTLGPAPAVPQTAVGPPHVQARPARGVAGKPVRLSFVALGDGAALRGQITVRRGSSRVFGATTAATRVLAQRVYSVVWRPGKRVRGSYTFCVRLLAKDGMSSPQSCASVTIRS